MVIHAPLDLEYWLINVFSGSWDIFLIISFLAIAILSARFRIPTALFLLILPLFAILMNAQGWIILFIILIGGAVYFIFNKMWNR